MSSWYALSLAALALWGLWGFFGKLASATMDGKSVFFYQLMSGVVVVAAFCWWTGFRPSTEPRGVFWAVLTGLVSAAGQIAFFLALNRGKASVVTSVTAFYPVITIVLALLILGEMVTPRQGLAMGLAVVALWLFSV